MFIYIKVTQSTIQAKSKYADPTVPRMIHTEIIHITQTTMKILNFRYHNGREIHVKNLKIKQPNNAKSASPVSALISEFIRILSYCMYYIENKDTKL